MTIIAPILRMSRGLLNNSAHPLLGLILRRVWQGAFVFEDLAEIAAIDPAATGGALGEVLGLILRGARDSDDEIRAKFLDLARRGEPGNVSILYPSSARPPFSSLSAASGVFKTPDTRTDLVRTAVLPSYSLRVRTVCLLRTLRQSVLFSPNAFS
jgi:hypothetical protein